MYRELLQVAFSVRDSRLTLWLFLELAPHRLRRSATMLSMSRNKDNPIDWSAFDDVRVPVRTLKRNRLLGVLAVLMFVAAAAGCVLGFADLFAALTGMNLDDSTETLELMRTKVLSAGITLAFSIVTFIPASFALQFSARPDRVFVPVVLALVGMVATLGAFVVGSTVGAFADWRWLILFALALVYLLANLYVRNKARQDGTRVVTPSGAHSRGDQAGVPVSSHVDNDAQPADERAGKRSRPTKEELWDEKEIWK